MSGLTQTELRNLANEMGGEFDFAVEGTEERLEFAEFMSRMEQYDLGVLGAYNGNWRPRTRTDEKWTLVLEVPLIGGLARCGKVVRRRTGPVTPPTVTCPSRAGEAPSLTDSFSIA